MFVAIDMHGYVMFGTCILTCRIACMLASYMFRGGLHSFVVVCILLVSVLLLA